MSCIVLYGSPFIPELYSPIVPKSRLERNMSYDKNVQLIIYPKGIDNVSYFVLQIEAMLSPVFGQRILIYNMNS